MINIEEEIRKLLKEIGPGRMSSTAYDTAWVARLTDVDQDLSNQAMEWICENQLPDGSWGAKDIFYYHDRVICTLAAMIALTHRGKRVRDKHQIEKGLEALDRITSGATQGLASDPNGSTVGFEMIAPTLVAEAEKLGIIKQQGERILGRMGQARANKMSKLSGRKINKHVTPAFSAEMAGLDGQAILDVENLQETNGSVSNSPSATAYFAAYLKPNDNKAIHYLHQVIDPDGGCPDFAPIDVFELSWTLWNLNLIPNMSTEVKNLFTPFLDTLDQSWDTDAGIGTAINGTIKDGDDSSLVYDVLASAGRLKDIATVLKYEEAGFFRCFQLESNPSISTNIHALGALRKAGYAPTSPPVEKISRFLKSVATSDGFWFDKWHASPYYATAHAIITYAGYFDNQVVRAVEWILDQQYQNGSWGHYGNPTLEETAYCIQALSIWGRYHHAPALRNAVTKAYNWACGNLEKNDTPLWIGKALYCPQKVVTSSVLSALMLSNEIL